MSISAFSPVVVLVYLQHPYYVDACGRPTEILTCKAKMVVKGEDGVDREVDCGLTIGGLDVSQDHRTAPLHTTCLPAPTSALQSSPQILKTSTRTAYTPTQYASLKPVHASLAIHSRSV